MPPLSRETQSLGQQILNAPVGINGVYSFHLVPNASLSLIQKLQAIQNSAIFVAKGCVKMTFIDHLHEKTKMLPVQDNLSLIGSQYLARALQPNNPSQSVVTVQSLLTLLTLQSLPPRVSEAKKYSSIMILLNRFAPYLSNGILLTSNYGTTIKSLHSKAVSIQNFFELVTVSFRLLPRK